MLGLQRACRKTMVHKGEAMNRKYHTCNSNSIKEERRKCTGGCGIDGQEAVGEKQKKKQRKQELGRNRREA